MGKILRCLVFVLFIFSNNIKSQDFLGLSTGNYAGVTGVMLQPASIVDSRHKFDINLFSTTNSYNNNYLLLNRNAFLKFNARNFEDYQTFKSKYLSEANLAPNQRVWMDVNSRIQMPLSFMATTGKKSAIALNIQSRSMVQAHNLPQPFAQLAYNAFYYPPLNNAPVDASGFSLNTLSWIDVGFTYGRVLLSTDKHFIKAAFTAKYLGGVASLHMSSNNFQLSVNNDSSINFNTSNYQYSRNEKADFDIFDRGLKPDASAFGFNAGLVYEFRGNVDRLKYISRDDEKSYVAERRDVNKYMFRLGVSIVDAGLFKFKKASTVNNFSGDVTNWQLNNANFDNISQFDTALNNRTTALANNPRNYNVHLPTALSVQLDIRFVKGLYLNAVAYRPLKLNTSDDGYRFNNYGYYAITPRWEGRHFGIYIPYTFMNHENITDYKQNYLGATLRMGPVFLGSSNLGTMAFNKNLKAAEVHAGIKIGVTYGKPNKASMLIEKLTKNKSETVYAPQSAKDSSVIIANQKLDSASNKSLPLLIDYNTGKIYSDPNRTGNIIIINNNTYYPALQGRDSIIREKMMIQRTTDTSYIIVDSTGKRMLAPAKNDTTNKAITDSLNRKKAQLDSTIKKLEQLRKEMDRSYLNSTPQDSNTTTLRYPAKDTSRRIMTGRDTLLIAANPNRNYQPSDTLVADSMPMVVNSNDAFKKKLLQDSVNRITQQNATKNLQIQSNDITSDAAIRNNEALNKTIERQNQLLRQQDEYYQREIDNANRLQKEIKDLQKQRDKYNNYAGYNGYNQPYEQRYVPVAVPAVTPFNQQPLALQVRDTVYIKDTVFIRDTTARPVEKNDTLSRVSTQPTTVYVPVEKETIIRETVDYTMLPEEVILFELGKSALRSVYHERLNYLSGILVKDTTLLATITGHTDKTGSAAVNEALSKKRASGVSSYMQARGVKPAQLKTDAVSASDPAVTGNTKTAFSQNRRVTIRLSKK